MNGDAQRRWAAWPIILPFLFAVMGGPLLSADSPPSSKDIITGHAGPGIVL